MFFLPQVLRQFVYGINNWQDLVLGALHEADGQVHSFVGISQLPLTSPLFLHNGLKHSHCGRDEVYELSMNLAM